MDWLRSNIINIKQRENSVIYKRLPKFNLKSELARDRRLITCLATVSTQRLICTRRIAVVKPVQVTAWQPTVFVNMQSSHALHSSITSCLFCRRFPLLRFNILFVSVVHVIEYTSHDALSNSCDDSTNRYKTAQQMVWKRRHFVRSMKIIIIWDESNNSGLARVRSCCTKEHNFTENEIQFTRSEAYRCIVARDSFTIATVSG